jgi:hypothetical protein
MKFIPAINALVLLFVISASHAATEPSAFRYEAPLTGSLAGEYQPAKVTLTAGVIAKTHNNFADLRIFDQDNREVPYLIHPEILRAEYRRNTGLEIVKYEEPAAGSARITLKCPKSWTGSEGLILDTAARDFEKGLKVETSQDGSRWQNWAAGRIFDYSSRVELRSTAVEFPATNARFIRLTISDTKPAVGETEQISLQYKDLRFRGSTRAGQNFRINQVSAWRGKTKEEQQLLDQIPLPGSAISLYRNGDTAIHLFDSKLPLAQIEFDIANRYFYRATSLQERDTHKSDRWRTITRDAIYRLPGDAAPRLKLNLPGRQRDDLRLIIHNGDNEPLTVNQITVAHVRQTLYFLPQANKSYRLCLGSPGARQARYDLQSVLSEDAALLGKASTWQAGEPAANPGYKRNFFNDAETDGLTGKIFKGLILVMVAALGFWAWSALKKIN